MDRRKAFPRMPAPSWKRNTAFRTMASVVICAMSVPACGRGTRWPPGTQQKSMVSPGITGTLALTICTEREGITGTLALTICTEREGIPGTLALTICTEREGIPGTLALTICTDREGIPGTLALTICTEREGTLKA